MLTLVAYSTRNYAHDLDSTQPFGMAITALSQAEFCMLSTGQGAYCGIYIDLTNIGQTLAKC